MIAADGELSSSLSEWQNFQECLLHEVRWVNGLYSLDVVFNYVWDRSRRIRDNVLEDPVLVVLSAVGVESLKFDGALTEGMKREPGRINWGLSEVAWVRATEQGDLVKIFVEWEGERSLELVCVSASLTERAS